MEISPGDWDCSIRLPGKGLAALSPLVGEFRFDSNPELWVPISLPLTMSGPKFLSAKKFLSARKFLSAKLSIVLKNMLEVEARTINQLDIQEFPQGAISKAWMHIINNGIGEPVRVPLLIARGAEPGPVLGINAALHGNELNGIPVIQRLFSELDPGQLRGTIVGVLIANVPGLLIEQRKFNDGTDLNHIAPGKLKGNQSQLYLSRLITRVIDQFEYLIDLHTASFGRVNTYYIRADMSDRITSRMARLQNPEIILNNPPNFTTVRGNAAKSGTKAITLELKDPHLFQYDVIRESLTGLKNVLYDLKMLDGEILCPVDKTILCERSRWLYTDEGGILSVLPKRGTYVEQGQKIAVVKTVFGEVVKEYLCPEDGVVIGKSVNPINQSGSRILHLGLEPREIPCLVEQSE